MPTQKIEFPGIQQALLAGRLDTPDQPPQAWAVFSHCFTCSKGSKAAAFISRALAHAGFGVPRFDFTGLGNSVGDFANTHLNSNVDDLIAAADWLRANHGAPALLIGHSLGGAAVLAAAGRIEGREAVATIGAPFEPAHVVHQLGQGVEQIKAEGEATVQLAGRPFTVRQAFIYDLGPGPYDLFTGSLGACTAMTVRMFARRKQWPLDKMSVTLTPGRIHAQDRGDCETREGMIDRIERAITLTGDLDAQQRQRLMEIADKCPVHRTLHSEMQVITREVPVTGG
jgi:uncharacterized OsmC-like protein